MCLYSDGYHVCIPIMKSNHITKMFSVYFLFLLSLISFFIALNFSYSKSIIKYSSLDITPSSNAFEIYPLIVDFHGATTCHVCDKKMAGRMRSFVITVIFRVNSEGRHTMSAT